jgi:hypothetical protein
MQGDLTTSWNRQSTETAPAFQAFVLYRDGGPDRSLRGVAQALGKSRSLMARWSARHEWAARVDAWDKAQDERLQATLTAKLEDLGLQHAEVLRTHLAAISLPALELARRMEADPSRLQHLSDERLIGLISRAAHPVARLIELEREVRGMGHESPQREIDEARERAARLTDDELDELLLGIA